MRSFFLFPAMIAASLLLGGCMDPVKTVKGDYFRQRGNMAYIEDLNYDAAASQYREAMAADDAEANYRMGQMILEGAAAGTEQQAIAHVSAAAAKGFAPAQSLLGRAYLHGLYGVKKDPVAALGQLENAAAQNDEAALYSLALAYAGAFNVQKDPARAAACYAKLGGLGWNIPDVLKDEKTFAKKTKKFYPGNPGVFRTKLTQEYLNKLGYKAGPVNGVLTKNTQAAIRKFQQDKGRPATGKPSGALLRDLHKAYIERF